MTANLPSDYSPPPPGWWMPNIIRQYTRSHYYLRSSTLSLCARHKNPAHPIADYPPSLLSLHPPCTDCSSRLALLRRMWADLSQPVDD